MSLFVITVEANDLLPWERDSPFAVILADGIRPGVVMGKFDDVTAADAACEGLAADMRMGVRPLPMECRQGRGRLK